MKNFNTTLSQGIIAILFTVLFAGTLKAQDTLIYNDNHRRVVKLLEIGTDEIKFRELSDSSEITRVIDKDEIKEIRSGSREKISIDKDPMKIRFSEKDLKKMNAVKFEFFSPILNNLAFTYERVLQPWMNVEGTIGIIGAGKHGEDTDASGAFFRGGIKFIRKPDYKLRGQGMYHPLHGKYIEAEFVVSSYSRTWIQEGYYEYSWFGTSSGSYIPESTMKRQYTNIAMNILFGKQYFFDGGVVLDTYFGVGIGTQSSSGDSSGDIFSEEDEDYAPFTHIWAGSGFPMTFTAGLRLGGAF